jgi:beta-N-acetylhexosaminidase
VLVSDDMGMKAVADRYSIEELAVGAIEAGCDHLLVRQPVARQRAAFEAIVRAAEARSDVRSRVEESAARVAALKAACTVPLPAPGGDAALAAGNAAHQALAGSFTAVTWRRNELARLGLDALLLKVAILAAALSCAHQAPRGTPGVRCNSIASCCLG